MSLAGSLRIFLIWNCSWSIVLLHQDKANGEVLGSHSVEMLPKSPDRLRWLCPFWRLRLLKPFVTAVDASDTRSNVIIRTLRT